MLAFMISTVQCSFAQNLKETVYFDVDSFNLLTKDKSAISGLVGKAQSSTIEKIEINGHTDADGSVLYNLQLSKNRCQAVSDYLISQGLLPTQILIHPFGENQPISSNNSVEGRSQNRRVVVQVWTTGENVAEIHSEGGNFTTIHPPKPEPNCDKDTTLLMENGMSLTLNKCDYTGVADCISFNPVGGKDGLEGTGITTMTTGGSPLISGGMFSVSACRKICVTVTVPIPECVDGVNMKLWSFNATDGTWENGQTDGLTIDTTNEMKYYKVETCLSEEGGNVINIDAKFKAYPKIKVKAPRKMKLFETTLSFRGCPLGLYPQLSAKKPKRRMVFQIPCGFEEPYIRALAVNKQGDTLLMNYTNGYELSSKTNFRACKGSRVVPFFWKFKRRARTKPNVYALQPNNFEQIELNRPTKDDNKKISEQPLRILRF